MAEITYQWIQDFDPSALEELFLSVGWTSGHFADRLRKALLGSHSVASAWDGDRLVGLANCLSDGEMTVYFHYLLVHPKWQGQGIGRKLMTLMLERYADSLRRVLVADTEQVGFYAKFGFVSIDGTSAAFLDTFPEISV